MIRWYAIRPLGDLVSGETKTPPIKRVKVRGGWNFQWRHQFRFHFHRRTVKISVSTGVCGKILILSQVSTVWWVIFEIYNDNRSQRLIWQQLWGVCLYCDSCCHFWQQLSREASLKAHFREVKNHTSRHARYPKLRIWEDIQVKLPEQHLFLRKWSKGI